MIMAQKKKQCFKCKSVKPLGEFYKHPQMADGHVNKCKECNKKDVRENRKIKINYYREYDIARGNRQGYGYVKNYRERFPKKWAAHKIIRHAIKSGIIKQEPCENCQSNGVTHAHHDDYAKPLSIRWLCPPCHRAWHDKNGEAPNGI